MYKRDGSAEALRPGNRHKTRKGDGELSHTIELKKVSKYYTGEDSVGMGFSRINLTLDIGEFVAITGESGSGKSTLLNVISGLDTYEEGEMLVCGEETAAYGTEDYENYRKTYIGNIFQDFNLLNSYTVYQNIEAVMLLSGKKKKECKDRVLELIDKVGLSEYRRTRVSRLSGGQKQRVAIARALAKDAPIIVADEPTGNLDSASASDVMETLGKVSADKLVVIVTHNYEQAEPYVTRKLTMHDGKIIEDKMIAPPRHSVSAEYTRQNAVDKTEESENKDETDEVTERDQEVSSTRRAGRVSRYEREKKGGRTSGTVRMLKRSEIRLGLRNTFNLPVKFLLLFIVYFFVSTAVLAQYATIKNSIHESDLLGDNPYFSYTDASRIIVKKADESRFTEEDFKTIEGIPNIREIVKNDIAVDKTVGFAMGDYYIEGPLLPLSHLKESDLTYGHMPENDYEVVVRLDPSNDALIGMEADKDKYIGMEIKLEDTYNMYSYDFDKPVKVSGLISDENLDENSDFDLYGYSTIYASEEIGNKLLVTMMAGASNLEMNFGGTKVDIGDDGGNSVYVNSKVPEGKVYIFEDEMLYYNNGDALGKDFSLKVKNRFFESEGSYKVDKVITQKNCTEVGIPKDEYDMYYNCVLVNKNDYNKLFDKGFYQIGAYMENENDSEETLDAINSKGYTTLAIKDALSDSTGGYGKIINMLSYSGLVVLFVVLFFIAYGVIRLIMRSRNSYYSTLRILGATKKNTKNILKVELIVMMIIAYAMDIAFVLLVNYDVLHIEAIKKLLMFLSPFDYVLLGAVLLLMSLLIANRYSRSIFKGSAMKTFREEA